MNEESSFRLAWSAYLNTCSINEQPTLYHSSLHKQVKIIRFLYCLLVPVFVSNQKQRFFEGIFFHSMKSLWDIKVLRIRTLSQINHYDSYSSIFTWAGKTLTFAVPVVQHLQSLTPKISRMDGVLALIIVPTREVSLKSRYFSRCISLKMRKIFTDISFLFNFS